MIRVMLLVFNVHQIQTIVYLAQKVIIGMEITLASHATLTVPNALLTTIALHV